MPKLPFLVPCRLQSAFSVFGLFVVLAGLSLSALLLDSRWSKETGRLVCCFLWDTPGRVNLIISVEAILVCLLGTLMGLGWSWFFGHAVLWMLNGAWGGAVSKLDIFYLPSMDSIITGTCASFLVALVSLLWVLRRQLKSRPIELIQAGEFLEKPSSPTKIKYRKWGWIGTEILVWTMLIGTVFYSWFFDLPAGPTFFGCVGQWSC